MRLTASDVADLPFSCALFDRQGHLVGSTPEWQGRPLGALTYEAAIGSIVVVPDGCSTDVDGLVVDLVGEVVAASHQLPTRDRLTVEMLAAGLALVAGRPLTQGSPGNASELVEYFREGVRRSIPSVRVRVELDVDAAVPAPAAVALGLVQLARNASIHAGATDLTLRVGRGPTFRVEWRDQSDGAVISTSRRPDQRKRWGLGFARLLADALGGVVTAPGAVAPGVVGSAIGLGAPRFSAPVASAIRGRVERASRAWDEETGLPPGSALDPRLEVAVQAAQARPGQIGFSDVYRARSTGARVWLGIAPQSSLGRARDVLRGIQHENSLLSAAEPHATRIFAMASILATVVTGESPESVPPSTWERDFGPACAVLGVERVPSLGDDRLRYPEPRVTAYLLATLGGQILESAEPGAGLSGPALRLVPHRSSHLLARLLGDGDGAIKLTV
ncbi:MAG TPA: hypothetical protein VGR61_02385 [Candidatus Dormibacteraeota bacterium]|nr:hypothetical protein [Candidatus Dormibacteraeota bacterium]